MYKVSRSTFSSRKSTLKVLMADSSPDWGGQQYRLVREACWLRKREHKVLVLCGETSELAAHLKRSAPWIRVEKVRSWRGLRPLVRFASIVRQWQPDIIHTRSGPDSTWGCFFHFSGYAVVRSRHITIPERVSWHDAARYGFGCRRIIAAAHSIKRDLVTLRGACGFADRCSRRRRRSSGVPSKGKWRGIPRGM